LSEEIQPEPIPAPEPVWGFADVALFFGLAVPFFLLGAGLTYGLATVIALEPQPLRALLAQFGGYLFGLAPLWIVFGRKFDANPMRILRMHIPAAKAGPSLTAGILASFAVLSIAAALRMPKLRTPMEKLLDDPAVLVAAAVLGVTIGPWVEELLFRGLLQPVLVRATGIIPGIVLSALPFAMLHGPQYSWSWRHVLLLTLAGSAFGWWRQRTGSTGAATLMHAGYNMVLFVGFIAAKWVGSDFPETI
jgi:membrane protease YdiL (CAAX protease family)